MLASIFLVASHSLAHSAVVTLISSPRPGTNDVAEFSIGPYEVAELISFPQILNAEAGNLLILKDGKTIGYSAQAYSRGPATLEPLVVAGPATIKLDAGINRTLFCTFRVSPEPFPPDRTVIVLPGTNQTLVTLECSTNLVHWLPATNGVYGPMPAAKFFRIKLEKPQ